MTESVETAGLSGGPGEAARGSRPGLGTGETVLSLVPGSCIQFLDFHLPADATAVVARRFYEEPGEGGGVALHAVTLEDGVFYHPVTEEAIDASLTYLVSGDAAVEPFLGKWLPVPYLRQLPQQRGRPAINDEGPTNWARIFITRAASEDEPRPGYHVVLAFDTAFDARQQARGGGNAAPTIDDVRSGAVFRFCDDEGDISAFVTEAWIDDWLSEIFKDHLSAKREGLTEDEWGDEAELQHLACYLTLLGVLQQGCRLPAVRFSDTLGEGSSRAAIGVDLVLDMGNSRTSALLRHRTGETAPGRQHELFPLPLRDLTEPWRVHAGIFSSRLEFARADFGKEALSRWSGRTNAFYWPSLVRVGAEAVSLAARQQGADDLTGVSAPTRYLWDERPGRTLWRFSPGKDGAGRRGPLVSGPQLALLTEQGDVLGPNERRGSATKPWFSRSSLMTFFAAEVLLHAVVAINAPHANATHGRGDDGVPRRRRLDRIVLTLPSGMHPREQQILRRRVEGAVDLVWHALGWSDANSPLLQPRPEISLASDNATNAQIAYLYNEISDKFRGKAREYFELTGRIRPQHRSGRSLRIASVDIGGGSTSLSVVTYELADRGTISGLPQVKDGFPIGGDDVAKAIIERMLLPAIEQRLADCRLPSPRRFLEEAMAGAVKGRPSWIVTLGKRFASELALPAAIGLLKEHDQARAGGDDVISERTVRALLAAAGAEPSGVVEDFEEVANDEGAEGFSLLEVPVSFLHRDLAALIQSVLEPVLSAATRVVRALDCDLVLLSGWLSRSPVVLDAFLETMPARPGRIVPMHAYRVGTWFPYAGASGQLGDPKLPAAIGAMLGSGAGEDGFSLRMSQTETEPLRIYLGRINAKGQIGTDDLMFVVDEQAGAGKPAAGSTTTSTISLDVPALIGQRRVPLDSWPAAPLYVLDVAGKDARSKPKMPLKITFERVTGERVTGERRSDERAPGERGGLDELRVVKACDCDGTMLLPTDVALRLQTMPSDAGHWLDTGALAIA